MKKGGQESESYRAGKVTIYHTGSKTLYNVLYISFNEVNL
jgi:hypothetical protein